MASKSLFSGQKAIGLGRVLLKGRLRGGNPSESAHCLPFRPLAEFASASLVGHCVVFNIGGNKYRLVIRILYPSQKVFVLRVMTHEEDDEDKWKEDCGCREPPPPKPTTRRPRPGSTRPPKRKRR